MVTFTIYIYIYIVPALYGNEATVVNVKIIVNGKITARFISSLKS